MICTEGVHLVFEMNRGGHIDRHGRRSPREDFSAINGISFVSKLYIK